MLICRNLYRERNFPTASRAYTKINLFYAYISEAIKLVNGTCFGSNTNRTLCYRDLSQKVFTYNVC